MLHAEIAGGTGDPGIESQYFIPSYRIAELLAADILSPKKGVVGLDSGIMPPIWQ